MFERRLKIFMILIFLVSLALIGRLFAVQVFGHAYWSNQALGQLTRPMITETTRGRILDRHGIVLALDTACTDACVDYRAIIKPPDPKWVREIAAARLITRLGTEYTHSKGEKRKALLAEESAHVCSDIDQMWATLATHDPEVAGDPRADATVAMDEIRRAIVQSVQLRRQWLNSRNLQRDEQRTNSGWLRYLAGSVDSSTDALGALAEETEPHVVIPALDSDACNFLGKRLEQFPGLVLRASTHRHYPLQTVACQVLGRLSRVNGVDLEQARRDNLDELRQYLPNDLIGREGIEALCEPLLRGSRGRIEQRVSDEAIISRQDFVPGADVQLTIDSNLQNKAQDLLQHVVEVDIHGQTLTPPQGLSMHAAIVVLDVKTNEVRVLASNPGFDVNDLQTRYGTLVADELNQPLINRATCDACEPGSTIKPLIGLGAITDGILGPNEQINCTGILSLPEMDLHGVTHMVRVPGAARCWILSENKAALAEMKATGSRTVPSDAMHGPLAYADALERSCDIFFETTADRLTPAGINRWLERFGLGRPTGIGLIERGGLRPDLYRGPEKPGRADNCLAGMGQGKVLTTPLQIANEAATIARGGIWMRPRILSADTQVALDAVHPRPNAIDMVDLHLNPEALRQARLGMIGVVDGAAGTGRIKHDGFTLAAKTGTADTAPLWFKVKDASGRLVNQKLMPVHRGGEEGPTPWYRSEDETGYGVVHAWYMGYAPVEDPQVAFCVLVEYAGAGGSVAAGPIASQLLEACASAGYFHSSAVLP